MVVDAGCRRVVCMLKTRVDEGRHSTLERGEHEHAADKRGGLRIKLIVRAAFYGIGEGFHPHPRSYQIIAIRLHFDYTVPVNSFARLSYRPLMEWHSIATIPAPRVVKAIKDKVDDAVIWDTNAQGSLDMVRLSYNIAKDFDAEAVIIIANEKITKRVVYGLETRGVPAYGAIWDN